MKIKDKYGKANRYGNQRQALGNQTNLDMEIKQGYSGQQV
jgi:hypothetical protein